MHKILLTCPPMIGMVDAFSEDFENANFDVTVPEFTQEMSEDALCDIIGAYDGWIIGDDPASRRVLEAGHTHPAAGKYFATLNCIYELLWR